MKLLKEFKNWRPISGKELSETPESEYKNILTFCWRNGRERYDDIGIENVIIDKMICDDIVYYNISWSDMSSDPEVELRELTDFIDYIGDGEWMYGLYKKM